MIKWDAQFFKSTEGGPAVRYACFGPDAAKAKSTILFVLGRNEWLEKYEKFVRDYKYPSTTRLIVTEHRSQGKSEGAPAFVKTYKQYTNDLAKLVAIEIGDEPYVMIAHSMGALVSLLAITSEKIRPDKILCLAPLLRLPSEHMPRWALFAMCFAMTKLGLGASKIPTDKHNQITEDNNKLTHDLDHYSSVVGSPLRQRFTTFAWLYATSRAVWEVFKLKNIKKITMPVSILVGGDERVVDPQGFVDWVALASRHSQQTIEFQRIEGARHELIAESHEYRKLVFEKLEAWL